MGFKKLPNEMSDEELLASLADIPEESEKKFEGASTVGFLSAFDISRGKEIVSLNVLYTLYRTWCLEPVPRQSFSNELAAHLTKVLIRAKTHFKIGTSSVLLRAKTYQLLKGKHYDKVKVPKFQQHFDFYLKHYTIRPGTYKVPAHALFHLYHKWQWETKAALNMSFSHFKNFLKTKYTTCVVGNDRLLHASVHKDILKHLPLETLRNLEESYRVKNKRKASRNEPRIKLKNKS